MKTAAEYAEFLKTPFWRGLSLKLRKAHGFKCQRCKKHDHCQAHHRFYRDDWFQTQIEDLECVCRACHEKEHGIVVQVTVVRPPPVRPPLPPMVGIPAGAEQWTRRMLNEARRDKLITKQVFKALIRGARKEPKKRRKRHAMKKRRKPQYASVYWTPRATPRYVNRGTSSN